MLSRQIAHGDDCLCRRPFVREQTVRRGCRHGITRVNPDARLISSSSDSERFPAVRHRRHNAGSANNGNTPES